MAEDAILRAIAAIRRGVVIHRGLFKKETRGSG